VDDDTAAAPRLWCRGVPATLLLLAAYALLSLFMSPGGYLGTDTGAKVATLDVMHTRGTARPVLGYWAEDLDPDGRLHPIYDATPVDGDWVHVTTLPMLQLGRPLWALGGYRLTLLLPMAGAIGAAWAARLLARRLAGDAVGWQAFWVVGLASPIAIYALDFWEHAPGVACILGAVALLAGVVDGEPPVSRALGAGALLGLAATMRTEAFVYTLVAVGIACVALLLQRRPVARAVQVGVLAIVGFAGPWIANSLLESAVGGTDRGGRVSGAAGGGFDRLGDRGREAIITLFALRPVSAAEALLLGGLTAALVAGAIVLDRRGDATRARVVLGMAVALHLITVLGGLGFVPGLLAAAPVAIGGLLLIPGSASGRYAWCVAVVALPIVWAFQFLGGAGPQWGDRYGLATSAILVTLGVVGLAAVGRTSQIGIIGLGALVTLTGVLWMHERTHSFDRLFDQLVERPEDVIVSRNGFFIREGGAAYSERLWLTAVTDADLDFAASVIDRAGYDTFGVLDEDRTAPAHVAGAELTGTTEVTVVGVPLYLHSYAL
jgi:hypothetical protein